MTRPGRVLVLFLVVACASLSGRALMQPATPEVRLRTVTALADGAWLGVLITTSEPVAYVSSQPDPVTILVDLRGVNAAGAVNRVSPGRSDALLGVRIEQLSSAEGEAIARVSIDLAAPVPHRVRSTSNVIRVELDREGEPADAGRAPSETTPADGATGFAQMIQLQDVGIHESFEATTITLRGSGPLLPTSVEESKQWPPRLSLEFPGVRTVVPAVTEVNRDPVEQVRVEAVGTQPLRTRVVFDLIRPSAYRLEAAEEHALAVIFDRQLAAPPEPTAVAAIGTSAPERDRSAVAEPAAAMPRPVGTTSAALRVVRAEDREAAETAGQGVAVRVGGEDGGEVDRLAAAGVTGTLIRLADPPGALGFQQVPAPTAAPVSAAQLGQRPPPGSRFSGDPVTLDFQNADLRAVLRTFAEISGLNIVIDPAVDGTVDVALRDVPWDQALDIILRSNQLGYSVEGTIVRIAPLDTLTEEQDKRRALAEAQRLAGEKVVLTRTLSYARADELAPLILRTALSPAGSVEVDERSNTVIITDLEGNLTTANDLIDALDRAEPQVEIEARIVQTSSDFARSIGVQWGINGSVAPELGNTTGLAFPNRGSLTGRVPDTIQGLGSDSEASGGRASQNETTGTAVNLPAPNASSAIGIALGAINGAFNLDIVLSALEREGKGRILSSPRVMTQNNVEAEMTQGIQIPIQTVANNTVTVTFKDAALTLRVLPQITADDTVIMRISLENATADFNRSVNGIPPIDTQRAVTQVLVRDGETTVLGGIFASLETTNISRTPLLHRIPLLGWLFKSREVIDQNRELLIFITPRIQRP